MSFKTEGSLRTQIHSIPEEQDGLRVPWLELVQNSPLQRSVSNLPAGAQAHSHYPWYFKSVCNYLKCNALSGGWLTLQYTVKKKSLPPPWKRKKCRTPTKQAHMYHVQGLSSNISLNGMPHFQPLCTCLIIAQRLVVVRLRVQLHANYSFVLRHGTFSCRFSSLFVMFRVFMRLISVLVEAEIYSEPSIIVASSDNVI